MRSSSLRDLCEVLRLVWLVQVFGTTNQAHRRQPKRVTMRKIQPANANWPGTASTQWYITMRASCTTTSVADMRFQWRPCTAANVGPHVTQHAVGSDRVARLRGGEHRPSTRIIANRPKEQKSIGWQRSGPGSC